jgi:hypothetical protein
MHTRYRIATGEEEDPDLGVQKSTHLELEASGDLNQTRTKRWQEREQSERIRDAEKTLTESRNRVSVTKESAVEWMLYLTEQPEKTATVAAMSLREGGVWKPTQTVKCNRRT